MISGISANTMYWGECMKYCGDLTENGANDWRVPTLNELKLLVPLIPTIDNTYLWTSSSWLNNSSSSGAVNSYRLSIQFGTATASTALSNCGCVR